MSTNAKYRSVRQQKTSGLSPSFRDNTDRIRDALNFISSDDRETWVRTGMAIKSELGDDGFDMWDEWSSHADCYHPQDARAVWKSLSSGGNVTVGTLFYTAKLNGWSDDGGHSKPTQREIEARQNNAALLAAKREADIEYKYAQSAKKACRIWETSKPAKFSHPYLLQKRVAAHWARQRRSSLVLPITNFAGNFTSLQFIESNGCKCLLPGGRKRGCFIHVAGEMLKATHVIICEGWATGCTLADDNPDALVLAAIDACNLKSVVISARCRWPSAELVIAGDDDRLTAGNPGLTKARAAADAVNAQLLTPQWPPGAPECLTDFNDLSVWRAER